MGLLDNTTPQGYYDGNDFGNYQFVSLTDIINQFMLVYVGEDKIIPKAKRLDVAFHAQRALAELSFDTFKSHKAMEITVPATLQMILPQDYVNYTKISWVDSAGIKHLMYPTSKTSNPSNLLQNEDGLFELVVDVLVTFGISSMLAEISDITNLATYAKLNANVTPGMRVFFGDDDTPYFVKTIDTYTTYTSLVLNDVNGVEYVPPTPASLSGLPFAPTYAYRKLRINTIDGNLHKNYNDSFFIPDWKYATGDNFFVGTSVGVTGDSNLTNIKPGMLMSIDGFEEILTVTEVNTTYNYPTSNIFPTVYFEGDTSNFTAFSSVGITFRDNEAEPSDTWNSYKSGTLSEDNNNYYNDNYIDDIHWRKNGSRYGLDPQYAQANGSFYIDDSSGKIHFSSNISGKTVVLDYISDSLGTDGEMQVHKFAEEAMYRWMSHAIIAGKANVPEYLVMRLKKEKLAAIRTAKLRLSNLKIEELTQILRGQSKWIKH
jgi:hypothetical protein